MKVLRLFLAIAIIGSIIVLIGCDGGAGGGVTCTTAKVRFTNTSSNPYYLFIDGSLKISLAGGYYKEYTLKEGEHDFKAEQESGYILYPTIRTTTMFLEGCKDREWIFP